METADAGALQLVGIFGGCAQRLAVERRRIDVHAVAGTEGEASTMPSSSGDRVITSK